MVTPVDTVFESVLRKRRSTVTTIALPGLWSFVRKDRWVAGELCTFVNDRHRAFHRRSSTRKARGRFGSGLSWNAIGNADPLRSAVFAHKYVTGNPWWPRLPGHGFLFALNKHARVRFRQLQYVCNGLRLWRVGESFLHSRQRLQLGPEEGALPAFIPHNDDEAARSIQERVGKLWK